LEQLPIGCSFLAADKNVWWFYPIGLFLGFAIYQIMVALTFNKAEKNLDPKTLRKAADLAAKSRPDYLNFH
jgi:putative Ca2+/H+ antiporter (TMEM165/GDT1 family)